MLFRSGAQSRARPAPRKRRRSQAAGPSNRTGAQTARKRKPGTRVRAKDAFTGAGRALNDDIEDEKLKKVGTGFRKQAGRYAGLAFRGYSGVD